MDVYFERIAGVAERGPGRKPRAPDDPPPEPMVPPQASRPLDENGFPLCPIAEQDELWFVQAAQLYRPLQRCANTARGSGLSLILSGVLALLGGLLTVHVVTIVIGLILVTLGGMERSAASDVAAAEPGAPGRLALNQLILFALVVLYSWFQMKGVQTALAATAEGAPAPALPPEMGALADQLHALGPTLEDLLPRVALFLYGGLAVSSFFLQGALGLYYLTRKRQVRAFHEELPPWVVRIVRTLAQG